ncbi:cell wall hydrolase [Domibacillus sp.]|uniref:cell wall hydrolase n=1 Tax=Domibacillus sp. TaxID=1969783 RepID=UPI0028111558|nr:cell wall hydrolase [Domibacillus sp.]
MAVVAHTEEDVKLLARFGNVGVNRTRSDCLDFKDIRTIRQIVFQSPGGFEATQKGYFYQGARQQNIDLARKVLRSGRCHLVSNALWFFEPAGGCPAQWFNQPNTDRYKSHCFFSPLRSVCPSVY